MLLSKVKEIAIDLITDQLLINAHKKGIADRKYLPLNKKYTSGLSMNCLVICTQHSTYGIDYIYLFKDLPEFNLSLLRTSYTRTINPYSFMEEVFPEYEKVKNIVRKSIENNFLVLKEHISKITDHKTLGDSKAINLLLPIAGGKEVKKDVIHTNLHTVESVYLTKDYKINKLEHTFMIDPGSLKEIPGYAEVHYPSISFANLLNLISSQETSNFYGSHIGAAEDITVVRLLKSGNILPITKEPLQKLLLQAKKAEDNFKKDYGMILNVYPRKNYFNVIKDKFFEDLKALRVNPEYFTIKHIHSVYADPGRHYYDFTKNKEIPIPINKEQYRIELSIHVDGSEFTLFNNIQYCYISFKGDNLVLQHSYKCERTVAWSKDLGVIDMQYYHQNFAEWLIFKYLPATNTKLFETLTKTKLHIPVNTAVAKQKIMQNLIAHIGV